MINYSILDLINAQAFLKNEIEQASKDKNRRVPLKFILCIVQEFTREKLKEVIKKESL